MNNNLSPREIEVLRLIVNACRISKHDVINAFDPVTLCNETDDIIDHLEKCGYISVESFTCVALSSARHILLMYDEACEQQAKQHFEIEQRRKRDVREKWLDRLLGFLAGLISAVLPWMLSFLIK